MMPFAMCNLPSQMLLVKTNTASKRGFHGLSKKSRPSTVNRRCHWPSENATGHHFTTQRRSLNQNADATGYRSACAAAPSATSPLMRSAQRHACQRPRQRLSQRQRLRPCQSLSQHGYGRRGGGGRGRVETPRNVVKKVSGRVRVCFFPSSLLKVVRCARLAGAQRSRAARPQRGSVNVRTPEEHRRSRVRVWRHCPPEGFRLKFQRPCDSARDDPAILQGYDPARPSVPRLLASTGAYLPYHLQ